MVFLKAEIKFTRKSRIDKVFYMISKSKILFKVLHCLIPGTVYFRFLSSKQVKNNQTANWNNDL